MIVSTDLIHKEILVQVRRKTRLRVIDDFIPISFVAFPNALDLTLQDYFGAVDQCEIVTKVLYALHIVRGKDERMSILPESKYFVL